MMASQKVRSTALQQFFRTLTYHMQACTPEKLLRLVYRNFCLAILLLFANSSTMALTRKIGVKLGNKYI